MNELNKGVGFYIKVIDNMMAKRFNGYLKEIGLTKPQADILRYLSNAQARKMEVKQKDIEEFFHISNPSVSGMLDRLEQKKLIERTVSSVDKRIRLVCLSKQGAALQEEMKKLQIDSNEEMLKGIPEELQKQGVCFLEMVLQNLMNGKEGNIC